MSEPSLLYGKLASWFHLLTAPEDYEKEAALYAWTLDRASKRPVVTLLELGSGGGNNASHLKKRYRMTLVDLSQGMLDVSKKINPECEHVPGDMRSVRLGRMFDAVLIHDAIMYLATEAEVGAAIATAAAHLEPGGLALFVPDDTLETFAPATSCGGHDGDGRSLRYLEWKHSLRGTTFVCSFAYLRREGTGPIQVEHEDFLEGIFPRGTWLSLIERAGFDVRAIADNESGSPTRTEFFLGVRR
ncbi:class I SAM-dependent methyltransferase [bacterium]|nr:class I SAM-dependent methyltransferase [bacterium]